MNSSAAQKILPQICINNSVLKRKIFNNIQLRCTLGKDLTNHRPDTSHFLQNTLTFQEGLTSKLRSASNKSHCPNKMSFLMIWTWHDFFHFLEVWMRWKTVMREFDYAFFWTIKSVCCSCEISWTVSVNPLFSELGFWWWTFQRVWGLRDDSWMALRKLCRRAKRFKCLTSKKNPKMPQKPQCTNNNNIILIWWTWHEFLILIFYKI